MTNSWREWEGRPVDGKFLLGNYLGGSEGSAVFRTRVGNGRTPTEGAAADAAIKLVVSDGAEAEGQLRRWKTASELVHPNLIRILAVGRAAVNGRELVYAVEELAEENLAQILPERALSPEEARGMLAPALAALEYVHGKGLVHGRIRPSNIMAAGDQVKLSSDSLRQAREIPRTEISRTTSTYDAPEVLVGGISPPSDVWSLGITLEEVLTQRVPVWDPARMSGPDVGKDVPVPFRGIVQCCLQVDPAKRCGVREIANRLEGQLTEKPAPAATAPTTVPVESIAAAQKKKAKGPYLLVLAAALIVAIFLIVRPRPSTGPGEGQTSSAPPQTSPQASLLQTMQPPPVEQPPAQLSSSSVQPAPAQTGATRTPPAQEETKPPGSGADVAAEPTGEPRTAAIDEIVERAMPQISPGAQRTIHGKIKVRVRVEVDAVGNVTEARVKESGSSNYFARAALEAARRWKFAPTHDENRRDWTLLFAFTRARTEMSATRAR